MVRGFRGLRVNGFLTPSFSCRPWKSPRRTAKDSGLPQLGVLGFGVGGGFGILGFGEFRVSGS